MSRDTPVRPNVKSAWTERHDFGTTSFGPLILSKGESSDNGSLGVRVVRFVPRSCRSVFSDSPEPPKAVLEFYRPSDKQVLCQVTLPGPGNSSIDGDDMCGNKTGISVVGINGINAADGWVSFDLRK
jgi:hypothetical protein